MSGADDRDDGVRELDRLFHAHVDGELDDAGRARLDALLRTDPEAARAFARLVLLHDGLAGAYAADSALRTERDGPAGAAVEFGAGCAGLASPATLTNGPLRAAEARAETAPSSPRPRRRLRLAAAAAIVLGVAFVAWTVFTSAPASAARAELARVVARASGDRTYTLHALDDGGRRRGDERAKEERRPAVDDDLPLDGATLHLRGTTSWVLERRDEQGVIDAVGSDGASAWHVPATGPVRVSSNPARFRGVLPGEQHDVAFVGAGAGLLELERAYDLELAPHVERDGRAYGTLVATRKPDVARGPKRVVLEYDPDTAALARITLDKLPQAKGGPRALELVLVDERELAPDYFTHTHHHAEGREVLRED